MATLWSDGKAPGECGATGAPAPLRRPPARRSPTCINHNRHEIISLNLALITTTTATN